MDQKSKILYAYTDGSACVQGINKGHGGFGTYFPDLYGSRKAFSLGFDNTKTGRMEVSALYYAIKAIDPKIKTTLIVYSDSEYVIKSFTEGRLARWIKNDFVGKKNVDLWKKIVETLNERPLMKLTMRHIKSHQVEKEKNVDIKKKLLSNNHIIGNMVADKLADHKRHKIFLKSDKI